MTRYRNQWRALPVLSDHEAATAYAMRRAGASINEIKRRFDTSWPKAAESVARGEGMAPSTCTELTRPIAGQCHGCQCATRGSDFTTDTFELTVRRAGTCRRDQTAVDDVLAGLEVWRDPFSTRPAKCADSQ